MAMSSDQIEGGSISLMPSSTGSVCPVPSTFTSLIDFVKTKVVVLCRDGGTFEGLLDSFDTFGNITLVDTQATKQADDQGHVYQEHCGWLILRGDNIILVGGLEDVIAVEGEQGRPDTSPPPVSSGPRRPPGMTSPWSCLKYSRLLFDAQVSDTLKIAAKNPVNEGDATATETRFKSVVSRSRGYSLEDSYNEKLRSDLSLIAMVHFCHLWLTKKEIKRTTQLFSKAIIIPDTVLDPFSDSRYPVATKRLLNDVMSLGTFTITSAGAELIRKWVEGSSTIEALINSLDTYSMDQCVEDLILAHQRAILFLIRRSSMNPLAIPE